MDEQLSNNPFDELPESLVEEMLSECSCLSGKIVQAFQKLNENKSQLRTRLIENKRLAKDTDYISTYNFPTTCGVDGSYSIEKMLSTDIIAMAAVAVEGLIPPTEKRFWPKPRHFSKIINAPHNEATTVVARAIMMCMELDLASKAPHDVVFVDNSLTTPLIYFNQAFNKLSEAPKELSDILREKIQTGLPSYLEIIESKRTDKIYSGIPKYSTKNEIADELQVPQYDDRGLLSLILEAKEIIVPISMQRPPSKWHIDSPPSGSREILNNIISSLDKLQVIYYRPYPYFPALRLEVSHSIASNRQRVSILLEAVSQQCCAPGMMEPYPLYLADRMVKHLGTALPAIRKATTQEMVENWSGDLGDIYLAMHGYRSETGY
jgi:hypothetical protein